jgi:hypothetical protein
MAQTQTTTPLKFRPKQEIQSCQRPNTPYGLALEVALDQRDELHAQRVQLARIASSLEAILQELKKPV